MTNLLLRKQKPFTVPLISLLTPFLLSSTVQAEEFIPLGTFGVDFRRGGVSSTGIAVGIRDIGDFREEAVSWSEETGLVSLGTLPDHNSSWPTAISEDGSVVVGFSRFDSRAINPNDDNWILITEPIIYTSENGMQPLPLPFEDSRFPSVRAVSSDGAVTVGGVWHSETGHHAIRWTEPEGAVSVVNVPGAGATDVSADGSVIVGRRWGPDNDFDEAFVWTEAKGIVSIRIPLRNHFRTPKISGDGVTVAATGLVTSEEFYEAFTWTEEGGAVGLGWLPGTQLSDGSYLSTVRGINADGSVIVGFSGSSFLFADEPLRGFIWTEESGMQDLQQVLVDEYGLGASLDGWSKLAPQDISANGQFIVGLGLNPDGEQESWFVRLNSPVPEPSTALLALAGSVLLVLQRRRHHG